MNVPDGAETSRVIDHLHVLGTVPHLASEKRGTAAPHCQKDGKEKAIELLIRDCLSLPNSAGVFFYQEELLG